MVSVKAFRQYAGPAVGAAGLAFLLIFLWGKGAAGREGEGKLKITFGAYIGHQIEQILLEDFFPVFSFAESGYQDYRQIVMERQMDEVMPICGFVTGKEGGNDTEKDRMTIEMILMAEAEEGHGTEAVGEEQQTGMEKPEAGTENGMEKPEAGTENGAEKPEDGIEDGESWKALLEAENQAAIEQARLSGLNGETQTQRQNREGEQDSGQTGQGAEGQLYTAQTFVPHETPLAQVDLQAFSDYETLVSSFYTIDKSTMIGSDQLNVSKLSSVDMTISKEAEGPQILIYHTHSQEGFADSVEGDPSTSIVGVGDYLAQILTDTYGYQVLHHTASYDLPSRDDAYSVALPDIEKVLEENPQIQVVIDLHRDAVDENTRLVTEIDGRPTARFMFFNGLSRTRKTGNIAYLYNENLDDNLAFSFQLQKVAAEYYPGLTRKIYLKAYRYNMHLRPRNLLIELGAQNNTVEEAMNACDPLAHILDMVLSGETQ